MAHRVVLISANRLGQAIGDVIRESTNLTYDMKPTRDQRTTVGTGRVADAIIETREKST